MTRNLAIGLVLAAAGLILVLCVSACSQNGSDDAPAKPIVWERVTTERNHIEVGSKYRAIAETTVVTHERRP